MIIEIIGTYSKTGTKKDGTTYSGTDVFAVEEITGDKGSGMRWCGTRDKDYGYKPLFISDKVVPIGSLKPGKYDLDINLSGFVVGIKRI